MPISKVRRDKMCEAEREEPEELSVPAASAADGSEAVDVSDPEEVRAAEAPEVWTL